MSALKKKGGVKSVSLLAVILTMLLALVGVGGAGTAFATGGNGSSQLDPAKAAVCKYVGKPGVDERLKLGKNPIVVDRKDWMVKGSYFQDAQGRSYVIGFLNPGDPAPDVSQCPAPDVPPPTDHKITIPTVPVIDECGPGNAHYGDVPSGNYTVVRNEDGSITLTAKDGYVFTNGKKSVTLPKPEEKNTAACEVVAPKGNLTGKCGVIPEINTPAQLVEVSMDNSGSNVPVSFTLTETIDNQAPYVYPSFDLPAGGTESVGSGYTASEGKMVSLVLKANGKVLDTLTLDLSECAPQLPPPPKPPVVTPPVVTPPSGHKPPVTVTSVDNHSGQNCAQTWTWHTTTTTVNGKVASVVNSKKVYKAKAVNTCSAPVTHVVPGSGAPHTGGGDLIDPKDTMALVLVLMAGGGLLLRRRKLAQVS